jgi:V-type H+-transporting ATPase subunit a
VALFIEKSVFIIFYKVSIESKLKKICDAFSAHRFLLPDMDDSSSVDKMLTENAQELVDSHRRFLKIRTLAAVFANCWPNCTERWTWIVLREEGCFTIPSTCSKADVSGMLRGEGWVVAEGFRICSRGCRGVRVLNMDLAMPGLVDLVPQPLLLYALYDNKFTYGCRIRQHIRYPAL